MKVKSVSRVLLFATPWTVAYQASPSLGFSRQEYWKLVVKLKASVRVHLTFWEIILKADRMSAAFFFKRAARLNVDKRQYFYLVQKKVTKPETW